MKKLLEENKTLTQIVYDAGRISPGRIHQSMSQNFLRIIRLKNLNIVNWKTYNNSSLPSV